MKTPIRDPFKSMASSTLQEIIPPASKINFFNLYGGFLESNLGASDRVVVANTNRYVIYEFWKCALENPNQIADVVKFMRERELLNSYTLEVLQDQWAFYKNPYLRAALFFLLNNCSTGGRVSTGTADERAFSPFALTALRSFAPGLFYLNFYDKLEVLDFDFEDLRTDFVVFSLGKFSYNLFEHGTYAGLEEVRINHRQMRTFLNHTSHKTLFLYEMHPHLPKFYKDHKVIYLDVYGRPTTDAAKAREVIVANFGIS